MPKFNRDVCEVCGNPIFTDEDVPKDLRDEIYRPPPEEVGVEEVDFSKGKQIRNVEGMGTEEMETED